LLIDVQQVGWGILSFVPNKFNGTAVTGLPFEVDKAEHASAALFRLYKSGLLDADYNDTVPLILMALPQNAIHLARAPARTLENLNGMKIASGSKVSTDVIAALGGAGISLITTEYYEGLQRRTVDGILTAWTAIGPFKLQEVTAYHIDTPLGGNQGGILMTRKRYDSLPADARRVIDANAGEQMSRSWATYWDKLVEQGRALGKAQGHTTVYLSPEQTAAWRKRIEPITEEWVKATPNGRRLLDAYRDFKNQVERGN
jgi:TRAP-type C4-dicarboxylate transport system substrate-binding protein